MILPLLFAWFSFAPVTDQDVLVQCPAYLLRVPGERPLKIPCIIMRGEPDWWARAGWRLWDVPVGQAIMICPENINDVGQASECGEVLSYEEDMLWWR